MPACTARRAAPGTTPPRRRREKPQDKILGNHASINHHINQLHSFVLIPISSCCCCCCIAGTTSATLGGEETLRED